MSTALMASSVDFPGRPLCLTPPLFDPRFRHVEGGHALASPTNWTTTAVRSGDTRSRGRTGAEDGQVLTRVAEPGGPIERELLELAELAVRQGVHRIDDERLDPTPGAGP
jgi:hypothetical protein